MPALGVDCFVMTVADRDAVPRIVLQVAQDPRVESVQAMHEFHVLAQQTMRSMRYSRPQRAWHLADVHKIATGNAVSIAEVDHRR
jgi:hypothetical protein